MTLQPGAFPYDSSTGRARGIAGDDAFASRWRGTAALLLNVGVALALAAVALSVLTPPRGGVALPLPVESAAGVCTRSFDPTPDLAGLLAGLRPGDVACLAAGVFGARGVRTDWLGSGTAEAPIVLRPATSGTVQVQGFVNLAGSHLVLDGLVFDGPTGFITKENTPSGEQVLIWAQGSNLVIRNCEVRDGLWRAGIYISGRSVTIDSCWVHDIGPWSDPEQIQAGGRANNIDHGVYWGEGSSGTLINSLLEHNLAYGVQISAGASDVLVSHNTIVRNGTGGVIWAEETSGSLLVNNIIALNDGYAVNAHLLTGTNNIARNNLAWGNRRGEWNDNGPLITRRNGVADPLFVGPGDYHLRSGSPAVDAAEQASSPAVDLDGTVRPQGTRPDLGAFERRSEPATP